MTIRRSIQPLPAIARRVRPVLTADHLRSVVDAYLEMDEFVFDVETRGEYPLDPCRNDVFWVALGGHGRSDVIPMGHSRGEVRVPSHKRRYRTLNPKRLHERKRDGGRYVLTKERTVATTYWPPPPQLRPDEVFDTLEPLFFSKRRKVGHNVKFDLRSVSKYYDGQVPPPPYGETMIAQHLLNENLHAYTLNALIKEHFGSAYPQQGKNPDEAAFTDLALYAGRDARYTWLLWKELTRLLEEQGLLSLLDLEMDVLSTLVDMEQEGVVIDTESLTALGGKLTAAMEDMQAQVWARSGYEWNLDSNADKAWFVYDVCEHKPRNLTATGQRSTTRADLMVYGRRDVDVARVVNFGYYRKMYSTYVEGLRSQLVDGRIHTNVNQHRTVTGRLSCVSGATTLPTSRGVFRFDEYAPQEGDLVMTHRGRWMPVVRKVFKGRSPMVRVHLSSGRTLECTEEHRLMTPSGWVPVRDLPLLSEVVSYVGFDDVRAGQEEREEGDGPVPLWSAANSGRCSEGVGNHLSEREVHSGVGTGSREVQAGEGHQVLKIEDGILEPDEPEEWFPASQLQGGHTRRAWVSDAEGGWEVPPSSQVDDGGSSRAGGTSLDVRCPPHQRGQLGQSTGQLCLSDPSWSRGPSFRRELLVKVDHLGTLGTWDIEVEGDHSYLTQGFLNHNSNSPNLQNIPRAGLVTDAVEDGDLVQFGAMIRSMFLAPEGEMLVVADYDQIELRVLAHETQDPTLLRTFREGLDPHAMTAASILGKDIADVTPQERQALGKTINFAVVYGASAQRVAEQAGVKVKEAQQFLDGYWDAYPAILRWKDKMIRECERRRPQEVYTFLGRRRRVGREILSDEFKQRSRAQRQVINSIIQGSAADIIKLAMIDLSREFKGTRFSMVLSVHDELVATAPEEEAEECASIMGKVMSGVLDDYEFSVPLTVSPGFARRWSEAK